MRASNDEPKSSEKVRLDFRHYRSDVSNRTVDQNIEAPVRSPNGGNESELSSEDTIPRVRRPIRAGASMCGRRAVRHSTGRNQKTASRHTPRAGAQRGGPSSIERSRQGGCR